MAVGFDVLGHSAAAVGDTVRARQTAEPGVRIAAIDGVVKGLPLEAGRNTAGVAVAALVETVGLDYGFELTIEKGIPLGSASGARRRPRSPQSLPPTPCWRSHSTSSRC